MDTPGGVTPFAVAASIPTQPLGPATVPIAILGTDAVLAALPATPVQLAHACLRAGFTTVVPASWGDELIAAAVLHRLPQFGAGPAIQCSCPIVAHRLLAVGGDLRPVLLPLVPPPVAAARYVKTLTRPARARITYVGNCPGAVDGSIDIRMSPESLLAMLVERNIVLADQPHVFESVIPPDRRRFRSQPGGLPTADALWNEFGARTLVALEGTDFVAEVAQHVLSGKNVLIDAATRLGCVCSGAVPGATSPRARVVALEPPPATAPVVEEGAPIDLDLPVPAVSRTPVDVLAVPTIPSYATPHTPPYVPLPLSTGVPSITPPPPPPPAAVQTAPRMPSPRAHGATPATGTPATPRPVAGAFPVARDLDGRTLPRAYIARRRSPARGQTVVPPAAEPTAVPDTTTTEEPEAVAGVGSPVPSSEASVDLSTPVAAPAAPAGPARSEPPTPLPGATSAAGQLEAAGPSSPHSLPAALPGSVLTIPDPDLAPERVSARPAGDPARAGATATLTPLTPPPPPLPDRSPVPLRVAPSNPATLPAPIDFAAGLTRAPRPAAPPVPTLSRGQILIILVAVAAIAVCASTVVAVLVSRSATPSGLVAR